ncbi:hypothetical protein GCM10022381_28650 [Leifsonia kafniensis]|uniref:InlB B-repeat-containing protein n=1 Tax=Leifsonia kafniensis TaxID=475957 RepID=A0ABP7KPJ6_9MICO
MAHERLKRGIGSFVAAALVVSGASLALAAPANAADNTADNAVSAIAPDESSYLGWHEGTTNGASVSSLKWNGLTFGIGSDSQILNGLVDTGAQGNEIAPTALESLITSASVDITAGAVLLQVPITFGTTGWSTLRPAEVETTSASPDAGDFWVSSKPINDIAANTPTPLSSIITELAEAGSLRYSGFGMYAQASAPATVESMTWDGDTYTFARAYNTIAESYTVKVKSGDIRDNEDTYTGWHEGYDNETPAFSVLADGLHLGGVANSQILNGLDTPLATADLASLIGSADVQATGPAFFQVAVTFGTGDTAGWSTLRPANPDTTFALDSDWVSSKDIPATASTAGIAKNTPVALGDLAAAVEAQLNVSVGGFGVLAESGAPAVVSSLLWNGVRYNFVPVVVTPPVTSTVSAIAPDETSYLGWHEGTTNGAQASSLKWNGLTFGIGGDSQILNGLVATDAQGIAITSADLEELITSASVGITAGEAFLQVPITFGTSGWSTLRPAVGVATSAAPTADDLWVSSKAINEIAANTPTPLSDIITELADAGSLRYSGFGLFAQTSAPATVSSLTWGGDTYTFARAYTSIVESGAVEVKAAEIRENEETYAGWHEGYPNSSPAFEVLADGLHLGTTTAHSQILNGLDTPLATEDLASLIGSADVQGDGSAFFQVAVTFGTNGGWSTLRPANPDAPFTVSSSWASSKDIPETARTSAIAKNTPVALGDLAAAVEAQSNVKVGGFGVLAVSGSPAVVSSLLWNGVRYTFVPDAITPPVVTWTITFDTRGGSDVAAVIVDNGTVITSPKSPTRTGYSFKGWYTAASNGSAWNFATPVTADATVYAQWTAEKRTVTFDAQGGSKVTALSTDYNTAVKAPKSPTRTGYTFANWYTKSTGGSVWNFATTVTKNVTVYAQWTAEKRTITFDAQGGSKITALSTDYNTAVKAPKSPTRTGYTFANWYTQSTGGSVWNFATTVTKNVTVYAQWTVQKRTITFDAQGGSKITALSTNYNTAVKAPKSPTRTGYTFSGWYTKSTGGSSWNFNAKVTANATAYAHWTVLKKNVTFNSQGGSKVATVTTNYNTAIKAPKSPTRSGYTFSGWYTKSTGGSVWKFTSKVTQHTTVYAHWKKK